LLVSGACLAAEQIQLAAAVPTEKEVAPAETIKKSNVTPELEAAAELGVLDAQLKLAQIYASGESGQKDIAKAIKLYRSVMEAHAHVRPHYAHANGVARAFVALGNYYRTGVPGVLGANEKQALRLLHYAASYYGDADAQCDLAEMYLSGEGVVRQPQLAVNWLTNAARKRHARAQAMLGDLLSRGAMGVREQRSLGLALLSLARQNAIDEAQSGWIEDLYAGAYGDSGKEERERAAQMAVRWGRVFGHAKAASSAKTSDVPKSLAVTTEKIEEPVPEPAKPGFTNVGVKASNTAP
jgi:TPR repeat protein